MRSAILGSAGNALTLNLRITAGETNSTTKAISSSRLLRSTTRKAEIIQGVEIQVVG